MKLTNDEKKFLIELLTSYISEHRIDDNVFIDDKGELTQIWFDRTVRHNTEDIRAYIITHDLLNKLY